MDESEELLPNIAFKKYLREFRQAAELTQAFMAEECGVVRTQYVGWESTAPSAQRIMPTQDKFKKITKTLFTHVEPKPTQRTRQLKRLYGEAQECLKKTKRTNANPERDDEESLGSLLRKARLKENLDQREMASLLGMIQVQVGQMENDKKVPVPSLIEKVIQICGLDTAETEKLRGVYEVTYRDRVAPDFVPWPRRKFISLKPD